MRTMLFFCISLTTISVLTFNFYILQVLEEYKRKYSEVLERLNERNRQYQKLQGLLDSLRMHTLGTGEKDPIPHPFTTGQGGKKAMGRNKYNGSLFKQIIVIVYFTLHK